MFVVDALLVLDVIAVLLVNLFVIGLCWIVWVLRLVA